MKTFILYILESFLCVTEEIYDDKIGIQFWSVLSDEFLSQHILNVLNEIKLKNFLYKFLY